MKKGMRIILGVLVVIVVLIIIAFFAKDYFFSDNALLYKINNCTARMHSEPAYDCFVEFISEVKNPSICERADNPPSCFDNLAIDLNDSSICNQLPEKSYEIYERDNCFSFYADKYNDLNVCNLVKDNDGCLKTISIQLNDDSIQ
jgi:hypothetical protein